MSNYLIAAFITTFSTLVSLGFSFEAVIKTHKNDQPAFINCLYTLARSLSVVILSFFPYFYHSEIFLFAITLAIVIIHFFDGLIGIYIKNAMRTFGPIALSVIQLIIVIKLLF